MPTEPRFRAIGHAIATIIRLVDTAIRASPHSEALLCSGLSEIAEVAPDTAKADVARRRQGMTDYCAPEPEERELGVPSLTVNESLQLLIAPRSPFCRKVVACVAEAQLQDRISLKIVDPWTAEWLRTSNPLCKVPTLLLPGGTALFDSAVIVQYVQDLSGAALIPKGDGRWDALRREALADGLADAVIRRFVERINPDSERTSKVAQRQEQAITATLESFERAPAWIDRPLDVGHIALACAIDYLDRRSPELAWQQNRPLLANWFYDFRTRPSFAVASSPDSGQFRSIGQE